jgi:RNA polymerase sigma factor (sigma-70 family)
VEFALIDFAQGSRPGSTSTLVAPDKGENPPEDLTLRRCGTLSMQMRHVPPPFQSLLDEHAREVLAFLRAMVGPVEAEDCFQETFLAALRAYPRLERHDELRAWLFTIARRKAIDAERARRRRPTPLAELPEPATNHTGPGEDDRVWTIVAGLPPKQRAAVALRYACDLRFREIASALDCSEEAARRSVHEGLKKLRVGAAELREEAR